MGSSPVAVTWTSDFAPASSKEFLEIQATIESGFTLRRVRDMTRTYSQMHRTNKYSKQNSIIWPVWPNGWVAKWLSVRLRAKWFWVRVQLQSLMPFISLSLVASISTLLIFTSVSKKSWSSFLFFPRFQKLFQERALNSPFLYDLICFQFFLSKASHHLAQNLFHNRKNHIVHIFAFPMLTFHFSFFPYFRKTVLRYVRWFLHKFLSRQKNPRGENWPLKIYFSTLSFYRFLWVGPSQIHRLHRKKELVRKAKEHWPVRWILYSKIFSKFNFPPSNTSGFSPSGTIKWSVGVCSLSSNNKT